MQLSTCHLRPCSSRMMRYLHPVHPIARLVLDGDERGVARACRLADDRADGFTDILKDLYPFTGNAWIVGITGSPGAGKSTLSSRLVEFWRRNSKRVGVIAVDPSSPFSGGAILGDRIRMQRHFVDPDVFIRSLASRGTLGGLSRSAIDIVRILDAWGANVVLIETVGVGQDEFDVIRAAHSTILVLAPGMGDSIQAIKAGILEVADVFAVNKADTAGVDAVVRDLELMIALGQRTVGSKYLGYSGISGVGDNHEAVEWMSPIVRCAATHGQGVDALATALDSHFSWLRSSKEGALRVERRRREQLSLEIRHAIVDAALREISADIDRALLDMASGDTDPYTVGERLVKLFTRS